MNSGFSGHEPLFSIIVPTWNRPEQIQYCLAAVNKLQAAPGTWELIIVDDGSTPALSLPPSLLGPHARILHQDNRGPAAARNYGARHARGRYLAFTDDDCRPSPQWLAAFTPLLAPDGLFLLGGVTTNAVPSNPCAQLNQVIADSIVDATSGSTLAFVPSNNLCVENAQFHRIGGFSEVFPQAAGEDREFCERWVAHGGQITLAPQAHVHHFHPQTLKTFLAMHARYGRGARTLAGLRPQAPATSRRSNFWRAIGQRLQPSQYPLFFLSQAAVAFGFFRPDFPTLLRYAASLFSFWILLLVFLAANQAGDAEFGGPDEASHFVTSVMLRQYLFEGIWRGSPPLAFAQSYYDLYPKVALGHWPPVYYLLQGSWLSLTGVHRWSSLAFTALLTAAFGLSATFLSRRLGHPWPLALATGFSTAFLPATLRSTAELGSDILTGLLTVIAALLCQRWLEQDLAPRAGFLFALATALATLSKGTAFCLFLLPFAALLLSRRLSLLLRPRFWLPLFTALAFASPWYIFASRWVSAELAPGNTDSYWFRLLYSSRLNAQSLLDISGFALAALLLLSFRRRVLPPSPPNRPQLWNCLALLPLCLWIFLSWVSPHTESRLLIGCVPLLCLAAASGARRLHPTAAPAILLLALLATHFQQPVAPKPRLGFVPALAWAGQQPGFPNVRILLSSNASGEGAWISESCLRYPSPQARLFRANKELQSSNWMGQNQRLLHSSPPAIQNWLDAQHIDWVVFHQEAAAPAIVHQPVLLEVLREWRLARQFQNVRIYVRPFAKP